MTKTSLVALVAATLLAGTGCTAANRIVGKNLTQVGQWYGELGISGHLNRITVQPPSQLTKLSIIGDANEVMIEDHVSLGKIEIWGANNTVSIPAQLVVRVNQVGDGSRVIRRPAEVETAPGTASEAVAEPVPEPTGETPPPAVEPDDDLE
jgi:hypothetical protein